MSTTEHAVPTRHDRGAVIPPDIYDPAVGALRFLAVDAINRAVSGHPGAPLDLSPVIYRLFTRHLRHDPADPGWVDRDRFVLSGGHASMVLYGALHLAGYDTTLDDIRSFRQLGSRCAGHPERGLLPGVEVTTGPLGQGVSNAVGMAIAERLLAARFNREGLGVVDHRVFVECGDGDLMEGISAEACSLAGHLGLGKLTLLYDNNHVSLDGPTSWTFTEDVATRFLAYGWHVVRLFEVDDFQAIDVALAGAAQETERPTIVLMHSHIGIGTPIHDDHRSHGAAVGPEYAGIARGLLEWPYEPFQIPDDVYKTWRSQVTERAKSRQRWLERFERYRQEEPDLAAGFERVMAGTLPDGWQGTLPRFEPGTEKISTRVAAGQTLNALAEAIPELMGGAADVQSSTETHLNADPDVARHEWAGRSIHFGVREHAMGAIVNGIAAHGGLRPFGATFFCFSDYMRGALRLSAIMQLPCVWVFTHDSIGMGEDGTTHQPVEQLAGLRAMPGFTVIRPADANEAAQAWAVALQRPGPSALVLSRQGLTVLDPDTVDVRGAILVPGDDAAIIATGSEVEVALGARDLLAGEGIGARVVSLASFELFFERPASERDAILPPGIPRVGVEAASPFGWSALTPDVVAMTTFGKSGKGPDLYQFFGITPDAVAAKVKEVLGR
ncbi:MAG: transketolase [Solirubrobacteraceae bacterium]